MLSIFVGFWFKVIMLWYDEVHTTQTPTRHAHFMMSDETLMFNITHTYSICTRGVFVCFHIFLWLINSDNIHYILQYIRHELAKCRKQWWIERQCLNFFALPSTKLIHFQCVCIRKLSNVLLLSSDACDNIVSNKTWW